MGRGDQEAYCYLFYRRAQLSKDAQERLMTIANMNYLGAGFEIAMRDMEIRGAGEMLGIRQSGKTKDIGITLYIRLLEQKIQQLQKNPPKRLQDCKIDLDISYYIAQDFFHNEMDKIHFFRDLETIESQEDLQHAYQDLLEEHGKLPSEITHLFFLLSAKLLFQEYGIIQIKKINRQYVFEF